MEIFLKVQIVAGPRRGELVRVLAVNNYPADERFLRVTDALERLGAKVARIDWSESSAERFDAHDGVVLSGSPDMLSESRVQLKYRQEEQAIVDSHVPILGICFGHQMMARAFGSDVVKDGENVKRFVTTEVLTPDGLFRGLPARLILAESRQEIVKSLPYEFELLARSDTTKIAAMKHRSRPLYGVQSHPERYSQENPDGGQVLSNFLKLIR